MGGVNTILSCSKVFISKSGTDPIANHEFLQIG